MTHNVPFCQVEGERKTVPLRDWCILNIHQWGGTEEVGTGTKVSHIYMQKGCLFLKRQVLMNIAVYPRAHKSERTDLGGCKRQVSKKANIHRAKVKVHCDSQNGSHLRRED